MSSIPTSRSSRGQQMMETRSSAAGADLCIAFDNVTVMRDKSHAVLEGVSGLVRGGRLTALVSCCGARGDFYLLNAIAGQDEGSANDNTGTIVANGTPVVGSTFRQVSALIDEDLTMNDELTARQNIEFSASMRVEGDHSTVKAIVESVLDKLDLGSVADRPVRKCTQFVRRRVSVAKELVLNPTVILVDNCLQGLPTHEARIMLRLLKTLTAEEDRAVVLSMVQPRWTLLELVDDIILIEGNHLAFCGPTEELLAAVVLDAQQTPEASVGGIYKMAAAGKLVKAFEDSGHAARVRETVDDYMSRCALGGVSLNAAAQRQPLGIVKFFHLLRYSVLEIKNNLLLYVCFAAALLIVAVVLSIIYTSQTGQSGMQNRIGIIFFLISSTFLHNILFVDHRHKMYVSFQRHKAHGYYSSFVYLSYYITTTAFTRFLCTAAFAVVVFSLANIDSKWDLSGMRDLVAIVAFTSFSTALVVFFVCAVCVTPRVAHFVLFAIYTLNVILAGLILNVNTLPKPFQIMSFGSHVRLGYEAAVLTQFEGQAFGCVPNSQVPPSSPTTAPPLPTTNHPTVVNASDNNYNNDGVVFTTSVGGGLQQQPSGGGDSSACYTGDQYIHFLGFHDDRKWKNLSVMAAITGIVIVLCYVVMLVWHAPRVRRKK